MKTTNRGLVSFLNWFKDEKNAEKEFPILLAKTIRINAIEISMKYAEFEEQIKQLEEPTNEEIEELLDKEIEIEVAQVSLKDIDKTLFLSIREMENIDFMLI